MLEIALSVAVFTTVILVLVLIIVMARSKLVARGVVLISVNDQQEFQFPVGVKLLNGLADAGILLPSPCGGNGTCGQCRVRVLSGGGSALPTETSLLSKREIADHVRLACQVAAKQDLRIRIADEFFGVRKLQCEVASNRNVATFIKELVLNIPAGEEFVFRAGGYVQIECPPYDLAFADFQIDEEFRDDWDRYRLWRFESHVNETVSRAYSMANFPLERGIIKLNVRIATPAPGSDDAVPPGIVSSYIFGLTPGDTVTIAGPFGDFFAKETDNEMIFIGGGAGMAPMRAHIFDQLERRRSDRKITFWYGARSGRETFYVEDFDRLAAENENFDWHIALSDPVPTGNWSGYTGFIHDVLYEEYLANHPAPEDCEYYMCGPPMMNTAVIGMLENLGVTPDYILFDDFGA